MPGDKEKYKIIGSKNILVTKITYKIQSNIRDKKFEIEHVKNYLIQFYERLIRLFNLKFLTLA